jgi:hypothetical protein
MNNIALKVEASNTVPKQSIPKEKLLLINKKTDDLSAGNW